MDSLKENLKNRNLFKHMGLKILSLLLAIILWMVVMNIDDYTVTRTIRNIPVVKLNTDSVEALGKVYEVLDGETVDIVVKGPRSVTDQLTVDDFVATADFSELSITNSVQIKVEAASSQVAGNIEISSVTNTMNLSIEDKITREMSLKVVTKGTLKEGYALGTNSVTPNIIEISGPESTINRVTEVRAVVDVSGRGESFETTVTPLCVNAYGESMTGKTIEMGITSVKVKVAIHPVKTIPIKVDTEGSPQDDYVITGINYNPTEITIAGDAETLDGISSLLVGDIPVAGIDSSMEMNIALDGYLPDGVYLADTNTDLAVKVTVEKLQEKEIEVAAEDVELRNQAEGLEYELTVSGVYKIRLKGLSAKIETVSKESLEIYLNLDGKTEGVYGVSPSYTKPSGVEVTLAGRMQLTVKAVEETTEEGSSTEEGETSSTEGTGEGGESGGEGTGEGGESGEGTGEGGGSSEGEGSQGENGGESGTGQGQEGQDTP